MEVIELWNRLVTLKVDLTFRSVLLCVTLGRVSLRCSASPSTNGANKHTVFGFCYGMLSCKHSNYYQLHQRNCHYKQETLEFVLATIPL